MRLSLNLTLGALTLFHFGHAAGQATSDTQSNVVLSAHLGPYPIAIYDHEVKTLRPDPLAPSPENRRLMITVYRPFLDNFTCPLEYQSKIPYASPIVAAALLASVGMNSSSNSSTILSSVQLYNCSRPVPASSSSGPLLLFSPGSGGSHQIYSSTLQAAASSGYTVVAVDHTYEAAAVVFPDGFVAYPSAAQIKYGNGGLAGVNFLQSVRDADVVSVLDAIERGEVPGFGSYSNSSSGTQPSSSSPGYTTNSTSSSCPLRAVVYGHSFGGSTAVNVAAHDSRILAAATIDGPFYGPVANGTIQKPLLMLQSREATDFAPTWPGIYSDHVRGWKTWVRPNNTVHYSYTDLPQLADLLDLRKVWPEYLTGTVDGQRLQEIVWRYTTQFFDYVFEGAEGELLTGPSAQFPDVEFVGHAA